MDITTFTIRLLVALLAGGAIGFERQWNHKRAGLHTNNLVAMGAAIYVLISIQMIQGGGDVTRIIGQVVVGVGFLGAGVILHQGWKYRDSQRLQQYGVAPPSVVWQGQAILKNFNQYRNDCCSKCGSSAGGCVVEEKGSLSP